MVFFTLILLSQIGSPQGVHLLDDSPLLPSSDAEVSALQLQADIDGLKKQRPGLGAGVALTIAGGSASLLGALYSALSFAAGVPGLLIIGAVGLGIGLPLIVLGAWLLYNRIEVRNRIDEEIVRLRRELQIRKSAAPHQQYHPAPPLLNLPPPQVLGPESSILIAQFD